MERPSTGPILSPHPVEIVRASFAIVQDQGRRKRQEDYAAFESAGASRLTGAPDLIVLADGMGGHAGGDVASRTAVETFLSVWRRTTSQSDVRTRLRMGLEEANDALDKIMGDTPELEGMGCTIVALRPGVEGLVWLSVGDSPMWRVRGREVTRLNADHSHGRTLDRMAEMGLISETSATSEHGRNQLAHAVAGDAIDAVDEPWTAEPLISGDTIVLASDGLNVLSSNEIAGLCKGAQSAQVTAHKLLVAVLAKDAPNQDNVTIAVLRVQGGRGAATGFVFFASFLTGIAAVLIAATIFAMWPKLFPPPASVAKPPPTVAIPPTKLRMPKHGVKPHSVAPPPKGPPPNPAKKHHAEKPTDPSGEKPKVDEAPIT